MTADTIRQDSDHTQNDQTDASPDAPDTSAKSANLRVRVWRGDATDGRFQTFRIPTSPNQTVLDAITYIQRHHDAALAYRFACRVGMCGSCAMTVNGAPRWTCRTLVSAVVSDDTLDVRPLRNMPVIRDLVTDMTPFFERWTGAVLPNGSAAADAAPDFEDTIIPPPLRRLRLAEAQPQEAVAATTAQPAHAPTERTPSAAIPANQPERLAANDAIECINCGVCYAACDVVAADTDYMGPAALNRAWAAHNDTRRPDRPAIERHVTQTGGCHTCHTHGACAAACPVGLNPSAGIAGLKRETSKSALRGIWRLGMRWGASPALSDTAKFGGGTSQ